MTQPIKFLSACGMLGYGFPEEGLKTACQQDIAFIGVDAGSTDPGPYYLGSGRGFVKEMQIRRDLELLLLAAREKKIPLIIGSAGGSGARPHVEAFLKILLEISDEHNLHYKLAVIYSDINKTLLRNKLLNNEISPCGPVPELTVDKIDRVCNPVAQFGVEPIISALQNEADVIVAGRCCDTAIFAAYPIWKGFNAGLAMHCAKIAECGALCAKPVGANDSLLCTMNADCFIVEPVNPGRVCTPDSVAAHSLYEQPNPECFYEPEGMINMRESVFEQISPRAVKVSGTKLIPPQHKTLKLEGAELKGYRTMAIAGISDPMVIEHIDEFESGVRAAVKSNLAGVAASDDYTLIFRRYGLDAATFIPRENRSLPCEVGLLIEVIAKTQPLADNILSLTRSTALHQPFEGRKATAGNLAFPFSPSDVSAGEVYEFSLYHLMQIDDPELLFPVEYRDI